MGSPQEQNRVQFYCLKVAKQKMKMENDWTCQIYASSFEEPLRMWPPSGLNATCFHPDAKSQWRSMFSNTGFSCYQSIAYCTLQEFNPVHAYCHNDRSIPLHRKSPQHGLKSWKSPLSLDGLHCTCRFCIPNQGNTKLYNNEDIWSRHKNYVTCCL
jgi:hypothetical protein